MFTKLSGRIIGLIYLLISAALYATMPILSKLMYQTGLTAVSSLLLRYFFSLLILVIYLMLIKRETPFTRSPYAMIQGLTFIAGSLLYFYALIYLPAGLNTSIFYVYPAIVSVLAVIVFRERITWRQILALGLALVGIIIISGQLSNAPYRLSVTGVILSLGASFCYSCYTLLGQKTTATIGTLPLTATLALYGFVVISLVFPHELVSMVPQLTLEQLLLGLAMAVFNTVLAIIFYLKGLSLVGASRAALVSTAEPAFTLLFAFVVLNEVLSPLQGLGVLLVLGSTTLALQRQ